MEKHFIDNYNKMVVGFWLLLFILLWQQMRHEASFWQSTLQMSGIFLCSTPIAFVLSNNILSNAIHRKKMSLFIFYFILFSIIQSILMLLCFKLFYNLELAGIFPRSRINYDDNKFWSELFSFFPTSILINISFCGFRFYYEHTKLQKTHLETQLQVLKQQITPHFMFNVLNHIYILMQENIDLASHLLLKYADILRFQLYKGDKEIILLEHDVQFLKDFIDIETIRWIGKIDIQCAWIINDGKKMVPPLLFITLIENAFKHVTKTNSEKGSINIIFSQKENMIDLIVENTKPSYYKKKETDSGLGLQNLKKRLDLLFENKYSLEVSETKESYQTKLHIELN